MKVLYFVHTYNEKNGIANHIRSLIENLPKETECAVISGKGSGLPLFSSLRLPVLETIKAMLSEFDVMHIHGYGNFYSFFGAMVAAARRKPLVWTIHGYPRIRGARKAFYYVYRYFMAPLIFWKANRIISVSSDILPVLSKETKKQIEVMPNGVDLDFFRPKAAYRTAKFACYIGRLDPDKGADRMLECRTHPLLFIGPDEDGTKKKIAEKAAGREANVTFEEVPYEKMPSEYEKCRYVVLPSKYEGFPLTLLEAIAMERPFVSTDVGEVRATLSELFDSPEKYLLAGNLEEKIAELEKSDLRSELRAARKKAEKYSWKSVAVQVAGIYLGLLEKAA